jgi:DNA-3-methyladenine glycosylase
MKILPASFYKRNTLSVAEELLGKVIVKEGLRGIIVETEAYRGVEDKACHAATKRKETCFPMWGPPGISYVYLTYGLHYMFNIVTEEAGYPAAVLIRAVEPIEGEEEMKANRPLKNRSKNRQELTTGPGKFTQAFGINNSHNNLDLTTGESIYLLENSAYKPMKIKTSPRIGVDYAREYKDLPWRYYIEGSQYISRTI